MTGFRGVLGWTSWLFVAALFYGIVWTHLDDSLCFALPTDFYVWLGDLLGIDSHDGSYDLFIWSTSLLAVLALHVIAWIVLSRLKLADGPREMVWRRWQRRIFSIVGWICWLLVATFAIFVIGDAIYQSRGGKLSNDTGKQVIEYFGGFFVVGLLHLAVLQVARFRQR